MAMTKSERLFYERAQSTAQKYQNSHEKLEDIKNFLALYKKVWTNQLTQPEKNLINALEEYIK